MPTINPALPADNTGADVADYNVPIQAILALINGGLDGDNISAGSLPWSVMDSFTDEIPAAAMEDNGNLAKFRDELGFGMVASGCVFTQSSGLTGQMTAGVIYTPDGARVAVTAVASKVFTASKDTFVTIAPNGTVTYDEKTVGAAPSALGTDYIRLCLVRTSGSAITSVNNMSKTPTSDPTELIRFELQEEADTIILPTIPARKFLTLEIYVVPTGTINMGITFNGDTGANYARQFSSDFGGPIDETTANRLELDPSSPVNEVFIRADIANLTNKIKMIQASGQDAKGSSGASNGPDNQRIFGKWGNIVDSISRIDVVNAGAGGMVAGTIAVVKGHN